MNSKQRGQLTPATGTFVLGQSKDGATFTYHRIANGVESALGPGGLHRTVCGQTHPGEPLDTADASYPHCTSCA